MKIKAKNVRIRVGKCKYCGRRMQLVKKFIDKEDMHMINHFESCSEWECVCGFTTYIGLITGTYYPYKKIILK